MKQPNQQPLRTIPHYNSARSMLPDELWTEPNNGGREQNPAYIGAYRRVRELLVDLFATGTLYASTEQFTESLQRLHKIIASSGVYQSPTGRHHLEPKYYGRLDDRYGRFSNVRLAQARLIVPIAARFGDPYGADNRLQSGAPNSENSYVLRLPGIALDNLPYDVVRYDTSGLVREIRDGERDFYPCGGYEYFYPDVKGVDEYLEQMYQLGTRIERAIKNGYADDREPLSLIAKQYQYGVCARPFVQINNSLFMQLVNMQLKLLGYAGITHGQMDIAAQRMQPSAFCRYVAARVEGQEP